MLNLRQNEQDRSDATTSLRLGVAAGRPRSWNNMLCLTRGVRVGFPRTQMWLACRARCSDIDIVKGLAKLAEAALRSQDDDCMFWAPSPCPALRFSAFFASYAVLASDDSATRLFASQIAF